MNQKTQDYLFVTSINMQCLKALNNTQSSILQRNIERFNNKMVASDLFSSPASLRVFLFCFVAFAAIPHHAFAGITRHYKFDVRLFIYLYTHTHTHI